MERELNQINVIPLVDVMLVLLVIVLTTATFISTGQIPVNLAKAKEVGDRKDVPIVITLTAQGQLFLNDRPLAEGELATALTVQPRESAVVVRADKVTLLERFVAVVDEVRSLATLLIQSDALGSSIAQSLRVHAEDMRARRMLKAEEKAHKLPVKLSIPLILCVLPSLMIVILSPAAIRIIDTLLPNLDKLK